MASKKLKTKEGLTEKEMRFVDAYLGEADRVAYEAARIAGSKAKGVALRVAADRLLTSANVQAEIRRRFERKKIGKDEVVARLSDQARVDILDFLRVDEHTGVAVLDLRKAKKARKGGLLKKYKPIVNREGHTITAAIETVDSHKALVTIAKLLGLLDPKDPSDGGDEDLLTHLSAEDAAKIVDARLQELEEPGPSEAGTSP